MANKTPTITKQSLLDEACDFTLFPNGEYFVEHSLANFVWNTEKKTLTEFKGFYSDYCQDQKTPCGRYDGSYTINGKVGTDFELILK